MKPSSKPQIDNAEKQQASKAAVDQFLDLLARLIARQHVRNPRNAELERQSADQK